MRKSKAYQVLFRINNNVRTLYIHNKRLLNNAVSVLMKQPDVTTITVVDPKGATSLIKHSEAA